MVSRATPILFLDLDGTVRFGPEQMNGKFVNGPADVEIFPGVVDILKSYKERGWKIVAISNQGGIALGQVQDNDVTRAMQETERLCARLFDGILFCPHHPDAEGDENKCLCRKPRIGLIVGAMLILEDMSAGGEYYYPANCLMVGDMETDKQCAENANIPFMWAKEWRDKGPLE